MAAVDPSASYQEVLGRCGDAIESWRALTLDDVEFDAPKGFSSFTLGVHAKRPVEPSAVLYRHLDGKDNAILDFATEKATFLMLGEVGIAARCLHYGDGYRIEEFYRGRTLTAADVFDPAIQRKVADQLHRLHHLGPDELPTALPNRTFFELLHERWGDLARRTLAARSGFPADEQQMCAELAVIHDDAVLGQVMRCLPDREPVFCHNDTYHGNVFLLDDGSVRLLDFEFSCRNHIAFDFANLFAETVMEHGLDEPPHFRIGEPRYTDADLASLIGYYLDNVDFDDAAARERELRQLVGETRRALLLSDYMYAMAALPLALEPIQKIRFIPYAHQRFFRFLRNWDAEFAAGQPGTM